MKIIVFTDLHFRTDKADLAIDPRASLAAGVAHVNMYQKDADLVVFTGDIAHVGDKESYEEFHDCIASLEKPHALMIGNHDKREVFQEVFSTAPKDQNGFVQQIIDHDACRLILLDTLNAPPYDYPNFHFGNLCEKRLDWLTNALTTAGDKRCIIFMHHPPHETGFVSMDMIRLQNEVQFYDVIEKAGNVAHIVCGHVHRTISGSHRGIPFSVFKSTTTQMPMLFDVMDFHLETPEPPAYGILDIRDESVLVHTEDYGLSDLDGLRANASMQV